MATATPERRPLGQRAPAAVLSPQTDGSPSPQLARPIRFQVFVNAHPPVTIPMRCDTSQLTLASLVSCLTSRLAAKPVLAKCLGGTLRSITLAASGAGSGFDLDIDINGQDTLDCYLDCGVADTVLTIRTADAELDDSLLAKPPSEIPPNGASVSGLASTAASYANQTKRVLALRAGRGGPADVEAVATTGAAGQGMSPPPTGKPSGHRTPGRLGSLLDDQELNESRPSNGVVAANGGAVAVGGARTRLFRDAGDDTITAASLAPTVACEDSSRCLPRPPKSRSGSPEDATLVAKPPSRGPSQDRTAIAPPRPVRMYATAASSSSSVNDARKDSAHLYKLELLLKDCMEDEAALRAIIRDDAATDALKLSSDARVSASRATQLALQRVEYAHEARAQAIAASFDDSIAREKHRFEILSNCIEEEAILRTAARRGAAASATASNLTAVPLKANKATFVANMETVARSEVETAELERRNKLSEDALLFFTREAIANDERFILLSRGLKEDEASNRAQLTEVGFRKLAMFHRQCASGIARLSGAADADVAP